MEKHGFHLFLGLYHLQALGSPSAFFPEASPFLLLSLGPLEQFAGRAGKYLGVYNPLGAVLSQELTGLGL